MPHNPFCERVPSPEHAPRGPFRLLEHRHGLAEIVERGVGVLDEVEVMRDRKPSPVPLTASEVHEVVDELELADAKVRLKTLKAENESLAAENWRLRAHVEELDESYEHPRQLDLASQ